MSTVAVFPLGIMRRACKYQGTLISRAVSIKGPAWATHLLFSDTHVYLVNAKTGRYVKGV